MLEGFSMHLSNSQINRYHEDGYILITSCFSESEIELMRAEALELAGRNPPGLVLEKDSNYVRALHGCHLLSPLFQRLTQLPKTLLPIEQLIDSPAYVYQFKINFKAAFGGDVWKWHQDYIFWFKEDGMPAPRCSNAVIFFDEVHEFNGPLMFIPGSHRYGLLEVPVHNGRKPDGHWTENVTADLKYSLDRETLMRLVSESSIVAPKGPRGSILFFHPNLVHGSVPNISPFGRMMTIITYNSVHNVPVEQGSSRPEFLV